MSQTFKWLRIFSCEEFSLLIPGCLIISALGQVQQVTKTQLAGTPLNAVQIIQQQQQKLPQAVTVQQFQQIVKQQQHAAQQGAY